MSVTNNKLTGEANKKNLIKINRTGCILPGLSSRVQFKLDKGNYLLSIIIIN